MLEIKKWIGPSSEQWEMIIEGMRNPKNSWGRMDSGTRFDAVAGKGRYVIGKSDLDLMKRLASGGPVHAKYRRMIDVVVTINAPLYWWKEFDTYKVGTVCNSCSTMHKIHAKEFTIDDFSHEHLTAEASVFGLEPVIDLLNKYRELYVQWQQAGEEKTNLWWQMIQLLPSSYNQMRTVKLNYEVLHNMYIWRKNHKLDEWHTFCDWIETLPYSELITLEER